MYFEMIWQTHPLTEAGDLHNKLVLGEEGNQTKNLQFNIFYRLFLDLMLICLLIVFIYFVILYYDKHAISVVQWCSGFGDIFFIFGTHCLSDKNVSLFLFLFW